jgi:P-type conjugative transfer protein TrbJ
MKNRIIATVTVLSIGLMPLAASAQFATFDATNFVQNSISAAKSTAAVLNQIEQMKRQVDADLNAVNMYKNQLKTTAALPNQLWSDIVSNMSKIQALGKQLHNLSVTDSNLDSKFQALFPSYVPQQNWKAMYAKWDQNTRDSQQQTLEVASELNAQFGPAFKTLQMNEQKITNSDSQLAVAQAEANIMAQQVEQTMKIQKLDTLRAQSEAAYYLKASASETHKEDTDQAAQDWLTAGLPTPAPTSP